GDPMRGAPFGFGHAVEREVFTAGAHWHEAAHHAFEGEAQLVEDAAHRKVANGGTRLHALRDAVLQKPGCQQGHGFGTVAFSALVRIIKVDSKLDYPGRQDLAR